MRIFIAGGTGAIGREVVPLLLMAGHDVVAATRSEKTLAALDAMGAGGVLMDALDRAATAAAVRQAAPDVVIHQLTALSEPKSRANAVIRREGTRNLVDAAKAAGVKRMIAQSIAWAYERGAEPATEDTPFDTQAPEPRATSVGGVAALESAVAEMEQHVVLRYGILYGPRTWYVPGGPIADALRSGSVPANDAVSSFVHVRDAATAALLALAWPDGAVNIVDDEPAAAHEWLPVLAQALGVPAPARAPGRGGWERGAVNAKARSLGWQPEYPSWRSGF